MSKYINWFDMIKLNIQDDLKHPYDNIEKPLKILTITRMIFASLLLGVSFLFQSQRFLNWDDLIWRAFVAILIITFLFTILSSIAIKRHFNQIALLVISIGYDTFLASGMIFITGFKSSPYLYLYLIVILYAGLIFQLRGGLIAACTAIAMHLLLFFALPTWVSIDSPVALSTVSQYAFWQQASHILHSDNQRDGIRLFSHAIAYFSIGILAGLLSIRSRQTEKTLYITHQNFARIRGMYGYILQSLSAGVITSNTNNHEILYANKAAKNLLNDPKLEGTNLNDLLHKLIPSIDKNENLQTASTQLNYLQNTEINYNNRILSLKQVPLEQNSINEINKTSEINDEKSNQLMITLLNDITEMRHTQQQLAHAQQLKKMGQLTATLAHEIRNPLACIRGSAELFSETQCEAERIELSSLIVSESDRLNNLIDAILSLARKPKLNIQKHCLLSITKHAAKRFLTNEHHHKLHFEILVNDQKIQLDDNKSNLKPIYVHVDETSFSQILGVLWKNSAEATNFKGKIQTQILTSESPSNIPKNNEQSDTQIDGDNDPKAPISLHIRDNGPGIPKQHRERIFEAFYTQKQQGTGLGLATAKQFAQHNQLCLSCEPDTEGAHFQLTFPEKAIPK